MILKNCLFEKADHQRMGQGRKIKLMLLSVGKLILVAIFFHCLQARAQDNFKVMYWKTEATLRSYLIQNVHYQYDVRRDKLKKALESDAGLEEYRNCCRRKYLTLLGEFPEKSPLNAQVTKRLPAEGYILENIIFESRPGHHVTAGMYIPEGTGPWPAVLFFCGHEMTSKATESYQETAILFVQNGFLVLVVDPVSQGERVQFTDSLGMRILRGSTTEHTLLNAGANLVGSSIVAWELYDNVRALDYLAGRPDADKNRIGCLGNSGGGAQTAYFIAYDDRIRVAAPCSNIASRERNLELAGAGDGCQQLPFEGREQIEIGDFLAMFAPKPLLILAGRYDFVDYTGTEQTFNELSAIYTRLGAPEKVSLVTVDDGHGISKEKREAAVEWFSRWLCNRKTEINENELVVLDEKKTWCTSTGQVNSHFPNEKNVQDISLQTAHEFEKSRSRFLENNSLADIQSKLRELLAIGNEETDVKAETTVIEKQQGYILKRIILRRKGEVPLPLLYFLPDKPGKNDTVIIRFDEEGKNKRASDESYILKQMKSGNHLILADLRGMGEMAENAGANEWKYYNREYHNAIISLHIGRPLPGQRVTDILSVIRFLSTDAVTTERAVRIEANGAAANPAIFAAFLLPQNIEIVASSTVKSFFEILENPMEKDWYSYVIPGLLKYFDIPDLIRVRPDLNITYTN